jgi:TPR repeat protein
LTGVQTCALPISSAGDRLRALLQALDEAGELDAAAVARQAVVQARAREDRVALADALRAALAFEPAPQPELAPDLAAVVRLGEAAAAQAVDGVAVADAAAVAAIASVLDGLDAQALRDALESCAAQGDRDAAYTLGRGLCGLATPGLPAAVFDGQQNMRKGAAFLLRAADAGCDAAWLHLYRLHADHSLSVANPQMARFFLEKAAARGQAEAQRKLGALMLRESGALPATEQAIAWLHAAAAQQDAHAATLLQSLVLPVAGSDAEAAWGIAQVQQSDPWLAARLALARHFGLTKLEGLCVDPVDGQRPWGLVVGRNPFISQVRLSAPRAIPALGEAAQQALQQAVALYGQARGSAGEGDLRSRSLRQRRLFERLGLDESLYFADASATTLEALRLGPKWAWRARQPLSEALAA